MFGRKLSPEIENALRILELENNFLHSKTDEAFQLIKEKGKAEDKKQLVLRLEKIEKRVDRKIASWKKLKPEFQLHPATIAYKTEIRDKVKQIISFLKGEFVTFKNW